MSVFKRVERLVGHFGRRRALTLDAALLQNRKSIVFKITFTKGEGGLSGLYTLIFVSRNSEPLIWKAT